MKIMILVANDRSRGNTVDAWSGNVMAGQPRVVS
jgi:hypothetical protein